MKNNARTARVSVSSDGKGLVSQAGAVLLWEAMRVTGLSRGLSLKGFAQNQLWCEIVALASELLAWTQLFALAGQARRWEPKRLRLRLFSVAGRLARGGRRLRLRLAQRWPGPARSLPRSPACKPSRPADQPEPPLRHGRSHQPGPVEPRQPARQPGSQPWPAPENHTSRTAQASKTRRRKIEASVAHGS